MSYSVVVGAGGTGVATALLLAESGEPVRLVTRRGSGPVHSRIERVAADAVDAGRLTALTRGARTLFNCAAPRYHRWPQDFPPLAAALLAAAEATGAGYVMLGNLYGYGPVDRPMTEDMPLAPSSLKGAIRARLWLEALAAQQAGRVRVTEVRASDLIGRGGTTPFTAKVVSTILAGRRLLVPGDFDTPHSWSGTVDAARALVAASRHEQAWGRVWHVPTGPPLSIRELMTRFAELAGAPPVRLWAMPEWMIMLAAAGSRTFAEVPEMLYTVRRPFIVDSSLTARTFGLTPTPLDELLRENLDPREDLRPGDYASTDERG